MTAERGNHYAPGDDVPVDGIYRCDVGTRDHDGHQFRPGISDVTGLRFPPLPEGCGGINWVLAQATGPH